MFVCIYVVSLVHGFCISYKVALFVFQGMHQEPGLRQQLPHPGLVEGSLILHGEAVPEPAYLDTGEGACCCVLDS